MDTSGADGAIIGLGIGGGVFAEHPGPSRYARRVDAMVCRFFHVDYRIQRRLYRQAH
jgi:hypothetical protein